MPDTKFTPGPWEPDPIYSSFVITPDGMKICDIRGWGYLTGKGTRALGLSDEEALEVQKANMHLICAAPTLYWAIEQIIKGYEMYSDSPNPEFNALVKKLSDCLQEELAVARGEARK